MAINLHIPHIKILIFVTLILFSINISSAATGTYVWAGSNVSTYSSGSTPLGAASTITSIILLDAATHNEIEYLTWNAPQAQMILPTETANWSTVTYSIGGTQIGTGVFGYIKYDDGTASITAIFTSCDVYSYTGRQFIDITWVGPAITMSGIKDPNAVAPYSAGSPDGYFTDSAYHISSPSSATNSVYNIADTYSFTNSYEYDRVGTLNWLTVERNETTRVKLIIESDAGEIVNESASAWTIADTDFEIYDTDITNSTWNVTAINVYGDTETKYLNFGSLPPAPQSENTILWDEDSYIIGDTGEISWSLSSSNWPGLLFTPKIKVYKDGVFEEGSSYEVPLASGSIYKQFSKTGTYEVRLVKDYPILPDVTIDSDFASVYPISPSYISVNQSSLAAGQLFDINFSYGFTPTNTFLTGVNAKRLLQDNTYAIERFWTVQSLMPITANTIYSLSATNATIQLPQEGKYIFELVDFNRGVVAQTTLINVIYYPQPPQLNITSSSITVDKTSYVMGDLLKGNIIIDNTNFSNACYLEIYNYDLGLVTNTPQPIYDQVTQFSGILKTSDYDDVYLYAGVIPAYPGNNSARIVTVVGTTRTTIAFDNFTLGSTNIYGYGLELSQYEACINDDIKISITAPAAANLTIENPFGNIVKTYSLNGSASIVYRFPTQGQYIIQLSKSGDAVSQAQATIYIKDCEGPAIIDAGDGEISNIYENIILFMTMPAFWGVIIWLGFVGSASMSKGITSSSVIFIGLTLSTLLAAIGMFAPFTTYIIVSTWIFAGIAFKVGQYMASGE